MSSSRHRAANPRAIRVDWARVVTWAMIFLLVILKIPIAYLCTVIWWAIKAEHRPEAPAALVPALDPTSGRPSWQRPARSRPRRPGGPERRPGPRERPDADVRAPVSSIPESADSFSVTDAIAGAMAAGSMLLSFIAAGFGIILEVEPRPALLAPVAALVALVAARMSARYQRLAFVAVIVAVVCWTLGMTLAVITEHPII